MLQSRTVFAAAFTKWMLTHSLFWVSLVPVSRLTVSTAVQTW